MNRTSNWVVFQSVDVSADQETPARERGAWEIPPKTPGIDLQSASAVPSQTPRFGQTLKWVLLDYSGSLTRRFRTRK